jgi:hypothetical protein
MVWYALLQLGQPRHACLGAGAGPESARISPVDFEFRPDFKPVVTLPLIFVVDERNAPDVKHVNVPELQA